MRIRIAVAMLLISLLAIGNAVAFDASNPWTGTVRWIVPSDTTFSCTFAGAETQIDFDNSLTSATQYGVQPDGQNNETSTPILTINNDGNVNLNFTCNLTTAKPSWATLKVSNTTSYSAATSFDTTEVILNSSVNAGGSTPLYLWSDVVNAVSGETTRTVQINTYQAS